MRYQVVLQSVIVVLCSSGRCTDAVHRRAIPAGGKWKEGSRFAGSTPARGLCGVFPRWLLISHRQILWNLLLITCSYLWVVFRQPSSTIWFICQHFWHPLLWLRLVSGPGQHQSIPVPCQVHNRPGLTFTVYTTGFWKVQVKVLVGQHLSLSSGRGGPFRWWPFWGLHPLWYWFVHCRTSRGPRTCGGNP